MPTANKTFVFKQPPKGFPVPGQDLVTEDRPIDLDAVPHGGLVVKVLVASYDPYLRGRMRDASIKSYSLAFEPNTPVVNDVVAKVVKSDAPGFQEGDLVMAFAAIAEYACVPKEIIAAGRVRKINNPANLEPGLFIGQLGMPGLTAWSSLYKIGRPKKGETIFISSAAGAVGQVVGQVAKHEGLRVIGSVGSDEKAEFIVKELGFDAATNYKKESPADALKRLAPEGIDIYYENVGGETLEAAITAMKTFGRIVACGMVSNAPGTSLPQTVTEMVWLTILFLSSTSDLTVQPQGPQGRIPRQEPDASCRQENYLPGLHRQRSGLWPRLLCRPPGEAPEVAPRRLLQGEAFVHGRNRQCGRGLRGYAGGKELWQGGAEDRGRMSIE